MKSKKNAFTLIELLAIIVILAIIAVITVPIILNIIENSRKGAATDSAYGYKDAVNKAYIQELAKPDQGNLKLDGTYIVQSNGTLNADTGSTFGVSNYTLPVSVSGDKPTSGKLKYENNVLVEGCLAIGDYKVTFVSGSVDQTVKGDCIGYTFSSTATWDNYHAFYDGESYSEASGNEEEIITSEFNNNWVTWIQENTETGAAEVCNTFSDGVVCSHAGEWASITSNGYVTAKKAEFESAGAICSLDSDSMTCTDSLKSYVSCLIFDSGVSCHDMVLSTWQSDCLIDEYGTSCGN